MSDTQFPLPNELRQALQVDSRPLNAYIKLSPEVLEYTEGLQTVPVPEKLTVAEAAAMFEVWGRDSALHSRMSYGFILYLSLLTVNTGPNDELFLSKYSEASGNARSFVHGGLLASLV